MRKFFTTVGIAGASFALVAGTAVSASAANSDVTFTLAGAALAVEVAADTQVELSAVSESEFVTGAASVSGELGEVTVTDNRGLNNGNWAITASSAVFANEHGSQSTAVQYTTGTVDNAGTTVTVTPTRSVYLHGGASNAVAEVPVGIVEGTATFGNNTATWTPTLTVSLPADSTVGEYSGLVVTSVA